MPWLEAMSVAESTAGDKWVGEMMTFNAFCRWAIECIAWRRVKRTTQLAATCSAAADARLKRCLHPAQRTHRADRERMLRPLLSLLCDRCVSCVCFRILYLRWLRSLRTFSRSLRVACVAVMETSLNVNALQMRAYQRRHVLLRHV